MVVFGYSFKPSVPFAILLVVIYTALSAVENASTLSNLVVAKPARHGAAESQLWQKPRKSCDDRRRVRRIFCQNALCNYAVSSVVGKNQSVRGGNCYPYRQRALTPFSSWSVLFDQS
jgi:hypothetical protein